MGFDFFFPMVIRFTSSEGNCYSIEQRDSGFILWKILILVAITEVCVSAKDLTRSFTISFYLTYYEAGNQFLSSCCYMLYVR